ncbi:MAG: cyclopropane fatty acyl phospholipid synthase [Candidatus Omnitrophica bacterium]|nr:cyclopropane fatty acyl phospholipid synthase [Candidatus Omnitrophota bacterium]
MNKSIVIELFDESDVQINGPQPWDIQIHNDELYSRILRRGSLGFGEAYSEGWWDCDQLDELIARLLRNQAERRIQRKGRLWLYKLANFIWNKQNRSKAYEIGLKHYDKGNELFKAMLDPTMTYSCGYWNNAKKLEEAQRNKLDLICRKLMLSPGMSILDIGCGWGSFLKHAASRYAVRGTGITVSKNQIEWAKESCKGLPVEFLYSDYRNIQGEFDRIVSIGMIEHVGYKNYRVYMESVDRHLKHDGIFLLHTIGGGRSQIATDPWIDKYIFPNSLIPSIAQIGKAVEDLFVMEDWHNFGLDYDKTLMSWHRNFVQNWKTIESRYDSRFYRIWSYYLLSSAGTFRARRNHVWQIVFSKPGNIRPYLSIR